MKFREFERSARSAVEAAIECGGMLLEKKTALRHGEWLPWVRAYFEGSERQAQRFMDLYRERDRLMQNPTRVSDLTLREALRAISSPPKEDQKEDSTQLEKKFAKWFANTSPKTIKIDNKEYTQTAANDLVRDLRKEIREANEPRENWAEELQKAKMETVARIEAEFAAEMAELKVKYGDVDEPRFAHIPQEEWERQIREAKSQRVMDVARSLEQMYSWPDWMGRYFPDEAAEAIEDMERKEDLINGWNYIIDWMIRVRDELEERGLRGE